MKKIVQHLDTIAYCIQDAINKIIAPDGRIVDGILMPVTVSNPDCGCRNLDCLVSMTVPKPGGTQYNVDDKIKEPFLTVFPPIGPWKSQKKSQKRAARIAMG